jgi:tetratricopeptide (TPR) repeat protein
VIEVELPTGTVTLLFTDIEGSTRMLRSLGDDHGAALRAQHALATADWPDGARPRVRMGIHTGSPVVVDDDYVGIDVHRAARICSAAHGDQVLVSEATRAAAAGRPQAALRDLGHHRLKDLDRPEHLYQLVAAGLAVDFPPPRSLPAPSNLPAVPTSFVGRDAELADVSELLARPDLRLLTLTGPGGTGKTRLALETCRAAAPRFPDGVWFVPLATVTDPARLRLLSLEDLRRGLQDRLPLLASRARDLPERQRTLRATIDWSYRLLAPGEQALLRRLSVFSGGCTWESAGAVAAGDDGPVDGLETLVEHSLVWRQETETTSRYRTLATIREYAGERLEQAGERDRLRRRHARWFASQAQDAYLRLDSEDQMVALDWCDAEMDNLRAALTWALERTEEPERLELALSLVRSLGYVWYTRGLTREALSWPDQIVAAGAGGPPGLRGVLLYWLGAFATRQGRTDQAAEAYREAVELFADVDGDDTTRVAKTLNALGDVAVSQGDTAEARRRWNQALALAWEDEGADARHTEAFVTANLGDLAFEEGDLDGARELLERALELLRPRGDRWATAIVQRYLAKVLAAQGERPRAYALLSETLPLLRAWSERTELADTLEILATLAAQDGEVDRVVRLLAAAAAIRSAAGTPLGGRQRALLAWALDSAAWADQRRTLTT